MTRIFEPDWPAQYSAGPARVPLEHGAYARLSSFIGGSGYETMVGHDQAVYTVLTLFTKS